MNEFTDTMRGIALDPKWLHTVIPLTNKSYTVYTWITSIDIIDTAVQNVQREFFNAT